MDMINNKNSIIKTLFLFLIIFQLVAFQSAIALGENEITADYKEKIINTSQALGIGVYEDFPVEFAGENDATKDAKLVYANPSDNRVIREIVPTLVDMNKSGDTFEVGFWDQAAVMWHNAGFIATFIGSQIADSGFLPWVDAAPTFEDISDRAIKTVKNSKYKHGKKGVSLFENEGFIKELEDISGAKFAGGNSTDYLIDGPESFAMKNKLMSGAKKSIYVASWALYDDITGKEAVDLLISKHKEGLDIKVIVDKKVVGIHGAVVIGMLEDAGIEVLRYQEKGRSADVWHIKMIIIDDEYAIVGGMNFGNVYSHRGGGPKWRDTEILYSGPALADSIKIFEDTWNAKIKEDKLSLTFMKPFAGSIAPKGDVRIAPVVQNPPTDSKVLLSMLKGIYGAGKTVNIENAYFVAVPAITVAILDALDRGVEVNILTNSDKTLNEQCRSMSVPLLKSLAVLLKSGANIYLKQGDTVHSKFMTVDGIFANIGSYNLHPRGERYDTELNVNVIGSSGVRELDEAFQNDISKAKKILTVEELGIKDTWLSRIIENYFLAQLKQGK